MHCTRRFYTTCTSLVYTTQRWSWTCVSYRRFSQATTPQPPGISSSVEVEYEHGLPVITIPLPSRRERCKFSLKPISSTVGHFLHDLRSEDPGIDRAALYTTANVRISSSTGIDVLLQSPFTLIINDNEFHITPPKIASSPEGADTKLDDVKVLVSHLYSTLNVEQHQLIKEQELLAQLEEIQSKLKPMDKVISELDEEAGKRTNILAWAGLGMMGVQFGVLARLTWWEYSWDIMEPVTYFVTYGTAIAMYAYFVLTRQEYNFVDVKDRSHLLAFYKDAKKQNIDIEYYNKLKNSVSLIELDLKRLRDPLQLNLPIQQLRGPQTLEALPRSEVTPPRLK